MTKIFDFTLRKQIHKLNTVWIQGRIKLPSERLEFASQIKLHQDTLTPNFSYMLQVAHESEFFF